MPDQPTPRTPWVSTTKPKVFAAVAAVMNAVDVLEKAQQNVESPDRFRFRGIDDTMRACGPAFRDAKVMLRPVAVTDLVETTYPVAGQSGVMHKARLTMHYEWTSLDDGSTLAVVAVGEAADPGDKAVSKAQSVALRTVLLHSLMVPTGDPDPDASSHRRAADVPPPGQYQQNPDGTATTSDGVVQPAPPRADDVRAPQYAKLKRLIVESQGRLHNQAHVGMMFTEWAAVRVRPAKGDPSRLVPLGRAPIGGPVSVVTPEVLEDFIAHLRQEAPLDECISTDEVRLGSGLIARRNDLAQPLPDAPADPAPAATPTAEDDAQAAAELEGDDVDDDATADELKAAADAAGDE